jgi:hypothetical protein
MARSMMLPRIRKLRNSVRIPGDATCFAFCTTLPFLVRPMTRSAAFSDPSKDRRR